ncbi:dynamin family protein [Myxosarcina sp. GI1]|uniref:dynamin family protein n=1 Tax=Myxosarcina sp. GI1 TaxID=1541065 RepID=UPI000907C2D2|nr:dynamin family protein [Myxosarcina sp. GI1]
MVDTRADCQNSNELVELDNLQREVIKVLTGVNTLIKDTQANLINDAAEEKYELFEQQISDASQNVAELQLRMAIVAPMKAGKSTIINAIVGQELLPNCAAAMTTIPTEISFNSQLTQPILNLSDNTLEVFNALFLAIKQQIAQFGIETLQQKLARYPHLIELLTKIEAIEQLSFAEQIVGRDAISNTLNYLNHVIRLYSVIDPLSEPLAKLKDVPQIQTPFLSLENSETNKNLGNLTIIDTPGPNEAGENLKLTAVVEEQLHRSSIVLIVLDFTQLNNQAAEAIKRQVKPIIETIGKNNLYVLVNKVDCRRRGDMTTEQVKDFVVADLELSSNDDRDRIFEVSALRAFAATEFLQELKHRPEAKLQDLKSVETLAQEIFGIDWEEELEDIDIQTLFKKAKKLWQKSGFAPFLNGAIAALMTNAAPKCLISALSLSRYRLLEIRDDLKLRSNAISQDTEKLQTEVKALENDLACLESCRQRLGEIEQIKSKLQQNLAVMLEELKKEAVVSVEDYFTREEYERADSLGKADIKARELLLSNIGNFELFPKWISSNLKSSFEYKIAEVISFKTEAEAAEFAEKAVLWAKQRLDILLSKVRHNTELEIEAASLSLAEFLTEETLPIINRAKSRLQTNFNIDLDLPPPVLQSEEEIAIGQQLVKTKTRLVDRGYEEKLVRKRAWYYWLGIVPFYSQEQIRKPYKKENYYTVSIHELVSEINSSSEKFIEAISNKIDAYLELDLQQQVNNFFANLDNYLGSYLQNLQQAQVDRQLSLEQRERLADLLNNLVPQTDKYLSMTDDCLRAVKLPFD